MKYFLDIEFLEGTQKTLFSKTKPTIDLISIGVVCEDGREYYAISKDFNLKEAWNRYDRAEQTMFEKQNDFKERKVYWIRENVLRSIWIEKCKEGFTLGNSPMTSKGIEELFTYKNFKKLISKYGKTNKQIAEEIKEFIYFKEPTIIKENLDKGYEQAKIDCNGKPEFYAYYADYDWVVFCWLFGKMIDLPKGFPMYCRDLKQMLDEHFKIDKDLSEYIDSCLDTGNSVTKESLTQIFHERLDIEKAIPQTNEHNALADAKWNYKLYKFLQSL
jgi:hypothetical protein